MTNTVRWNPLMRHAHENRHGACCVHQFCKDCGNHVSSYGCGPMVIRSRPEADKWDWWICCDNADCVNARGEGLFQTWPDWVEQRRPDDETII